MVLQHTPTHRKNKMVYSGCHHYHEISILFLAPGSKSSPVRAEHSTTRLSLIIIIGHRLSPYDCRSEDDVHVTIARSRTNNAFSFSLSFSFVSSLRAPVRCFSSNTLALCTSALLLQLPSISFAAITPHTKCRQKLLFDG